MNILWKRGQTGSIGRYLHFFSRIFRIAPVHVKFVVGMERMHMEKQLKYQEVEQYLRSFTAMEPSRDFGDLLRLILTGIEALKEKATDLDILENAHSITDQQAKFIQQLLDGRPESIEWFKDNIGHSSHTGLL
jgi:hypothetical protein